MNINGYIKLYRKILHNPIWSNINDWRLAETVLLLANWQPAKFQARNGDLIQVEIGMLITSIKTLSRYSGLTPERVRTSLVHLQKADFLTSKSTNHFTIVNVKNFSKYQNSAQTKPQAKTQRLPKDLPTIEEKEEKEEGEEGAPISKTLQRPPQERPDWNRLPFREQEQRILAWECEKQAREAQRRTEAFHASRKK